MVIAFQVSSHGLRTHFLLSLDWVYLLFPSRHPYWVTSSCSMQETMR